MEKEIIIISVGGSLIVQDNINVDFLKKFSNLILKYTNKKRFFIYVGGGRTARIYQKAMRELGAREKELDWTGIEITILNARLLKLLFGDLCHSEVIKNPTKKIEVKKDIIVAAGWKPGWSTDCDAVLLAKNLRIKELINLTNIDYVYTQDPKKFPSARPIKKINWQKFRILVGEKWSPGLSVPFDPMAAKTAQKLKMKVAIINGKKLERLENFLNKKSFIGTVIG